MNGSSKGIARRVGVLALVLVAGCESMTQLSIFLIVGSTVLDYWVGLQLGSTADARKRRWP